MRRSARSWLTLLLAVVVAAAVVAADRLPNLPEPPAPPTASPAASEARSGAWTCAVGAPVEGSTLAVTAVRGGDVGDRPGELDLRWFSGGEVDASTVPPVFPGAHVRSTVRQDADTVAVSGRWSGGPLALARDWRLDEVDDVPAGTISGPCVHTVSTRWVVPGMSTEGGNEARLVAANPYPTDATVAVGFVTPEGPQEPLALQNLTVPAHGTLEVPVNESMPEQADLAAVVRVLSGRAVVEGYQLARSAIGDVDGASLLSASTGPAEVWTVPWVTDREGDASWLWVVNLGDRPAPVELTLHTPDGGVPPEGLSEVTVAPGQVRRVDLRGTLPEGVTAAAVTARSDGAPVHVSGAVRRVAEDVGRTGFAVQLGADGTASTWLVAGGATAGRNERLDVVNPGSEPARFTVTLFNGSTVLRPDDLADLEVGPGQSLAVPLQEALGDVAGWSAQVVVSEGEVVVGRVGANGEGALHLVAHLATPATAWGPVGPDLRPRQDVGSVQRLGTAGGIRAPDPLQRTAPTAPTPAPDATDEPPDDDTD